MASLFKMALMLAALAAALAGRDTRDEDKSDDMEHEEIMRRQWQYNGPQLIEPEARRRAPEERRRSRVEPVELENEAEDPKKSHESVEPHRRERPENRRRRHKEHHRRRHEAEPHNSSEELKIPLKKEEQEDPPIKDESVEIQRMTEPAREMIEPKKAGGRIRNEIETVPRSKPPKTTQGPFGSDTTTTTEIPTTAAPTQPAPMLPPLSRRYRRIYNADETATIEDHPYLAAVLMNNELWCGGAIISSDMVFTAAHCLQLQYNNRFFREYVKMLTVRVGSSNATAGGEHLRVEEIFFHPNYKPQTLEFNYAVLRLNKNVSFDGPSVSDIEYSKHRDVPVDKNITFLGWGSVLGMGDKGGAVLLQKVELPVYDKADCADVYGRDLVTTSNFCAGYISKMKNVCNHDAGGPAVMDGQLVGLLSFSSKRCDEADRPAVFSSAGVAAEWLQSIPDKRKKSDELQQGWMNLENNMQ